MATITAIKQQKNNPQRVNLYLDGEFAFPLAKIVAAWLKVGQELEAAKIAELRGEDEVEKAFQRSINFLSYRPRSTAEVQRNLQKHKVPDDVSQQIIKRLETSRLLDDADFARRWVEDRNEFHPRGVYLLRMELLQKGIAEPIIEQTLSGLDEESLARRAAEKKARQFASLDWPEFRKKCSAFLARRGFGYEVAADACQAVWQEMQEVPNSN